MSSSVAAGSSIALRSSSRRIGPYAIQAAIAAIHAEAARPDATDWSEIVGLYDVLVRVQPTPVVALNRAVAVGFREIHEAEGLHPPLRRPHGKQHLSLAVNSFFTQVKDQFYFQLLI